MPNFRIILSKSYWVCEIILWKLDFGLSFFEILEFYSKQRPHIFPSDVQLEARHKNHTTSLALRFSSYVPSLPLNTNDIIYKNKISVKYFFLTLIKVQIQDLISTVSTLFLYASEPNLRNQPNFLYLTEASQADF